MITLEQMKSSYGRCIVCNTYCFRDGIIHSEGYIQVNRYAYNQYTTNSIIYFCADCWYYTAGAQYELEEDYT